MPLSVGTKLRQYEILELIAEGGMGRVWKAIDASKNNVAIKEILRPDSHAIDRLKREAEAANQVNSEFVAHTIELIEENSEFFLVQEFIDGDNISVIIGRALIPFDKAMKYLRHSCLALKQIHAVKIVHRDIKPKNIVLRTGMDFSTIVDFGIARLLPEHNATDITPVGQSSPFTPLYGSPEQYSGGDVGPESDVFSLGCSFYEMLTGDPLFKSRPSVSYFSTKKELDLLDFPKLQLLPNTANDLIIGMVKKETNHRLSVQSVLRKIDDWAAAGSTVTATSSNTWQAHWLQVILQALLAYWGPTRVKDELQLPPEDLRHALQSTTIQSRVSVRVEALLAKQNPPLIHSNLLRPFLAQTNDSKGVAAQRKLLNPQTSNLFHRELLKVLGERFEFVTAGWKSTTLTNHYTKLAELAKKLLDGEDVSPAYVQQLREAYEYVALQLGAYDISLLTRADFGSSGRWTGIIDFDPEEVTSHLRFSNLRISADLITLCEAYGLPLNSLRLVDCGVGGAHSTYFILKDLERKMATSMWNVRYRGYELVPDLSHIADCLISGEMRGLDSRIALFNRLHRLSRITPLIQDAQKFVENNSLEVGLSNLSKQLPSGLSHRQVDVVFACYSFHHLPNGEALRRFLIGSGDFHKFQLQNCDQKFRKRFVEQVIQGCKDIQKFDYVLPSNVPQYGPARVFLSLFNPITLNVTNRWDKFFNFLERGLPANGWRFDPKSEFLMVVGSAQDAFLSYAHKLLSPNGLLVIGDPDGTSGFNLSKIAEDPEISIGNFASLVGLKKKLHDSGRWNIEVANTIGKKGTDRYYAYDGEPTIGVLKDGEDKNLGYYLIARAIGPTPFYNPNKE